MAYTSSLSEYIDEQRKKAKEEADKKAKDEAVQAKSKYSRVEKDDVVVPKAPPVTTVMKTPVVPNYLPANAGFTSAQAPVQGPQPYQPQPDNPISNATNAWQAKDKPDVLGNLTRLTPSLYKAPEISITSPRPDTGPQPFITQNASPTVKPAAQPQPYQVPGVTDTRSFLKPNELQSWRVQDLTVGEGQKPGGLFSAVDYLKVNKPASVTQQPVVANPLIKGNQGVDTGVPGIGATGTGSDTLGIQTQPINQQAQPSAGGWLNNAVNAAVKPFAGIAPDKAVMDWLKTTPAGQEVEANMRKRWQTNPQGMSWFQYLAANVGDAMDVTLTGPRRLIEDTKIPGSNKMFGTDMTLGQVAEAGLTVAARATNPFDKESIWRNPATFNTPSVQQSKDALTKVQTPGASELPIDQYAGLIDKSSPAAAVGGWIKDTFMRNINEAAAVNKYVASLPPEKQSQVQIALTNIASGPDSTMKTVDAILGKNQRVQQYTAEAQEAQAKSLDMTLPKDQRDQYAIIAAEKGRLAADEKSMTELDYVSKYRHPGSDMLMSLFTDPSSYLPIDKLWEGYKAARSAKVFNVTAEQAQKAIPKAIAATDKLLSVPSATQDATRLVDAGGRRAAAIGPSLWDKVNPFAKTAETNAQQATTKIWNAATQLMANVSTKEDAVRLVSGWLDNPMSLIEGTQGLTSPAAQAAAVDGVYKVGAGVIANEPLLKVMPVLQTAGDKLKSLPSLLGEGPFNPVQFAGEVDNVVYDAARQVFGLDPVNIPTTVLDNARKLFGGEMPAGALKPVLRRLRDGTGVIDYATTKEVSVAASQGTLVIPKGKVVGSTTPKVWYDAQQEFKALVDAASNASASPVAKAAQLPFQIQRAILSDMYLGLNPGHWMRNAASATATLLTDGIYGTKNQSEMIGDLTHKFGVVPERELQNTIAGTGQEIPHWAERAVGANPYSSVVNKANEVWTGLTNVAGVPFGEQSFKLTAKYNSFQRLFKNMWKTPVETTYREGLEALGIAPDIAKTIVNHIVDAGITGNKADVSNTARTVLGSATIKQGLRELGIPDELLSIKGWAALNEVFGGHLPENVNEAAQAVKQVFTNELINRAKILNESPTQLGNYKWMATEIKQDAAALTDTLRQSGQVAGVPKEQVEQTVAQLAKRFEDGMTGVWEKFRSELAQAPDPQSALNLAIDTWAKHSELKDLARRDVDELGKTAAYLPQGAERDAAWLKKWQETPNIYNKLIDDTQKLFEATRARLMGVSGQPTEKVFNWWNAIDRYTSYDDQAIQQLRTTGLGLGAPTAENAAQYEQALQANRGLVDKSLLEMYDAFRRNPTGESLDMIVHAQQKLDYMAAQAAAYLQDELTIAKNANSPEAWANYYKVKGNTWNQFFDNAAIHNKATERIITADGATAQYKNLLTWEDPMYGNMRVLAPDTKTIVDNSADAQKMVKFNTGTKGPRVSEFKQWQVLDGEGNVIAVPDKYIPDEVKSAWEKIVNGEGSSSGTVPPTTQGPIKAQPPQSGWDVHKLEPGQTVDSVLAENTAKSKQIGGLKAPEIGEALGTHMIDKLKQAEQAILAALPDILTGKPNALTEAQRVGAMDLLSELLPQYDNALAGASQGASDMMNFAMLDPTNRRNADVWLSHLFPFHYFWSRSAKNWAERVLTKPGVVHAYYTAEKNIELENQQQNLPSRLQGTVPNPVAQFGIGPARLGNPLAFALPFSGYYPSQYINPEAANSDYEKMLMRVQQFTPGLMPMLKAAQDLALDKLSPNADGSQRFKIGDYAPNKFVPGIDLAGYAVQATTGQTAPNYPGTNTPIWGDEFDPYRTGRKASELGIDGKPSISQYAQQYAYNVEHGQPVTQDIPPEFQKQAAALYLQSTKGAAGDRLMSKAGSFLTGVPGYEYTPAEKQMQDETSKMYGLGYDQINNPQGSKQAVDAYRDQHPELQAFGTKGALVPDSQALSPGVRAQQTQYYDQADVIYAKQAKAVTDFLLANPNASSKELAEAKAPFFTELDALKTKYKDVLGQSGGGSGKEYDSGMNPKEEALAKLEEMLKFNGQAPKWPGKDATDAELSDYYAAKGKWEVARLDYLDKTLNQYKQEEPSYPQPWRDELNKLTSGEYSSELARKYQELKYAPDAEKAWSEKNSLKEEMNATNIQASKDRVVAQLGADAGAALDAYYALPKDSEERRAFKQANPIVNQAIMLSFNPDQYAEVEKRFGKDAWEALYAKPKYPTDTSDASMQAYYKQLDAYNAKYPNAEQIHLYVYGRPYKYVEGGAGGVNYDFGQDLDEVNRLFPNIWKDKANFPDGADKITIAKYMRAHPDLYGYKTWYDEHKDQAGPIVDDAEGAVPLTPGMLDYKGPRPVGSNRQPIGTPYADPASDLYSQTPPAQQWDTSMLGGQATSLQANAVGAAQVPGKTAQEYIAGNESYQKGVASNAKYQASQAAWQQKRSAVASEFGEDAAKSWEAYGNLPKDSKEREAYKATHPELRAFDMAAYNPKEYAEAKKLFGDTAWTEWAQTPPYGESPEAKAARSQYYDAHPTAKVLNAWLNGRPTADQEAAPGEGIKYDFGQDYAEAAKLFGNDIWSVFADYKSGFNKEQRKAYFDQHPNLSPFFEWWYGNSQTSSGSKAYASGYSRSGYAPRSYGGYGGGGGQNWGMAHAQTPKARLMDKDLRVSDQVLERLRQWRPRNIGNELAHAGDSIGPDNLRKWRQR